MTTPMIRELLCLPEISDAQISPDGLLMAYGLRTTNWQDNRYERRLVIASRESLSDNAFSIQESIQGASARWAPDGESLAYLAAGSDGKTHVRLWRRSGSDEVLCEVPSGSHGLKWSPQSRFISFLASVPTDAAPPTPWTVLDEAPCPIELFAADASNGTIEQVTGFRGHIASHDWHPHEDHLVCCVNQSTRACHWDTGATVVVELSTSGDLTLLPTRCLNAVWSPSGEHMAIERLNDPTFLTNPSIVIQSVQDGASHILRLPDECRILRWLSQGLLCLLVQRTNSQLVWLDPSTGDITNILSNPPDGFTLIEGWFGSGCALTMNHDVLSAVCYDTTHPGEAALIHLVEGTVDYVSDTRCAVRSWRLPKPQLVQWKIRDGIEIEGVLIAPAKRDSQLSPLVVVLHGGPTAMASQAPLADNDWIWAVIPELVHRGASVLLPNYRGSIGYGSDFRAANASKLGLRNADDVIAGIEYLAESHAIDAGRVAVLGASHGGYLAAFLAAHTTAFAAAVVRSGISDWRLNAQLNQNPDWECQYFGGTPDDVPDAYQAASVLPFITENTAPMLIVHGDCDQQAPTANAYALQRALVNAKVPCKAILYHGMGHGGATLRQTEHSLQETVKWFERWIGLPTCS